MTIKQIYNQYLIPPNLQKHMLRVAALAQVLTENWIGEKINKSYVVLACVFHDMANIIKFNFDKPLFKEESSKVNYWKKVQVEVIQKYGNNIHLATFRMCQEIGLPKAVLGLIGKLEWDHTFEILEQKDYQSAITVYCDMRIGPHGILPMKERINNLATRNKAHDTNFIKKAAESLEVVLQGNISMDLNDINDNQLNSKFNQLLKLEI